MTSGIKNSLFFRLQHSWRRKRWGDPVVVVSGLPRSGTSMMMRMLEKGGLPLLKDDIRSADENNPGGYYEYQPTKDLGRSTDKSWVAKSRGKGVKVISELLKELPQAYFYQIIFMRRRLAEIIASQDKMLSGVREQRPKSENERISVLFEEHLQITRRWLMHKSNFEVLEVSYSRVLRDPLEQSQAVANFLDRPLGIKEMASVVDPSLWRNREGIRMF